VPWFDALLGDTSAPRAVHRVNERAKNMEKVKPTASDLSMIETFYKADFERFGYVTGEKKPKAAAPELSPQIIAARDAEIKAANSAMAKASQMAGKIRRKIGK